MFKKGLVVVALVGVLIPGLVSARLGENTSEDKAPMKLRVSNEGVKDAKRRAKLVELNNKLCEARMNRVGTMQKNVSKLRQILAKVMMRNTQNDATVKAKIDLAVIAISGAKDAVDALAGRECRRIENATDSSARSVATGITSQMKIELSAANMKVMEARKAVVEAIKSLGKVYGN